MAARRRSPSIPLPKGWPKHVKSALLHAIALARTAIASARAHAATSRRRQRRLEADVERANAEIALLREELDIKDARLGRVPSRRRPRYSPIQRMRILQLKAARGWTGLQAAQTFFVSEETMASWRRRVDEEGEHALIQVAEPVNKFPDFVRLLVRQLKVLCPAMGKVRIAQVLARAGLHLGVTTVRRMLDENPRPDETSAVEQHEDESGVVRVVTAKYPGHVIHLDLTAIPTGSGFWVPWFPLTWAQSWPFCWWLAVVVDHFSRSVVGFAVFKKKPKSVAVRSFLGRLVSRAERPPKYLICDRDKPFIAKGFKRWCRRKKIGVRYSAVGKHGSIAVVERFIRSLKTECTRNLVVPYRRDTLRREIALYCAWHNEHRPSQALGGRTPNEVRDGVAPSNTRHRYEPRRRWPVESRCAEPQTTIKGKRGARVQLVVGFLEGRKHLPIVELKQAA